ncbi:MAG: 23S rRNA (uracil(1939)-C(5))-methyltransferase RlmD [Bacilli bacterium]|nr:23S rRNA (uracil(1939)-C(5))-methyltransferase RlmD [Bacilli bacterium]
MPRKSPQKIKNSSQILHGICVDISFEGKGVVKIDGDIYFVPGIFPGEEGDIAFDYSRGGAKFGKVIKLDKVSPNRIQPRCKICSACGGCCFQQYDYPAQLVYKTGKVKEQFRKIAKMDVEPLPCIGMDDPYFYRNKIQMPFAKDNRGNLYCGFYKENTHVIVPVDTCFIEDERAKKVLDAVKKLGKSFHIEPYMEDEGRGFLRHVLIRTSKHKEQVMVVLVTYKDAFPSRSNFVKALVQECPFITTVLQNVNPRHTNVILGEFERVLYGPGYIEDLLCGISFKISAKSFYQVNPVMTEKLYMKAIEAAQLTKEDVVFDAYSGIGTIGMVAAKHCKNVIAVEIVKEAVIDARRNAKYNGVDNIAFYCDDASSFMVNMANKKEHVDVLFMDPPRKGSDQRCLDAVCKLAPSRIVYVSCDPSTLARDIAYLSKKYKLQSLQPVDMFPHTMHVESVASLELKNNFSTSLSPPKPNHPVLYKPNHP